jgi:hypothetical protein
VTRPPTGRSRGARARCRPAGPLAALALCGLALLAALGAGLARGERTQRGNLIVSLDGSLTPLKLPRDRPAPVAVHLDGGLRTADGAVLPRVTRVELGLPDQGVISTRGLPTCSQRRLRNAKRADALAACRGALVGRGRLRADVVLPNQDPFTVDAGLLAFNGRTRGGRRAVLVHAFAAKPPTVVVLAFVLRHRGGRFGTALVADLPPTLGPWPHFAHFEITLSRRYSYRGRERSYLSASCPIPRRFTAGFFSFAHAGFTLLGGRQVGTGIARSCRAR